MKKKYEAPALKELGDIKKITQSGIIEVTNGQNGNGNGGWIIRWGISG